MYSSRGHSSNNSNCRNNSSTGCRWISTVHWNSTWPSEHIKTRRSLLPLDHAQALSATPAHTLTPRASMVMTMAAATVTVTAQTLLRCLWTALARQGQLATHRTNNNHNNHSNHNNNNACSPQWGIELPVLPLALAVVLALELEPEPALKPLHRLLSHHQGVRQSSWQSPIHTPSLLSRPRHCRSWRQCCCPPPHHQPRTRVLQSPRRQLQPGGAVDSGNSCYSSSNDATWRR